MDDGRGTKEDGEENHPRGFWMLGIITGSSSSSSRCAGNLSNCQSSIWFDPAAFDYRGITVIYLSGSDEEEKKTFFSHRR